MNSTMKRTLLLLTVAAFLAAPAFAQTQQGGTAGGPPHPLKAPDTGGGEHMGGGGMGALTPEEREELKNARQAAFQANPDLLDQMKALQDKINAAMIKADPKVAPIIAKLEAAREQHRDGQGAPGGPRDTGVLKPNGDRPGAKAGGDKPHPTGN